MIFTERDNFCVGCPQGCINCGRNKDVRVLDYLQCDKCGSEANELYDVYGEQLCDDCALKQFNKIDEDNFEDYLDNEDE